MLLNLLKYCLLLFSALIYQSALLADDELNRENQLKAVYLVHFADLTRWPDDIRQSDTFKVCLYIPPTLAPFLNELSQELVQGKQMEVEVIDSFTTHHQCQIIYFSKTESIKNVENLSTLYPNTLLVGNYKEFIEAGGAVSFTLINNKIKLLINLNQIRLAGLDISSKLLRIATVIE